MTVQNSDNKENIIHSFRTWLNGRPVHNNEDAYRWKDLYIDEPTEENGTYNLSFQLQKPININGISTTLFADIKCSIKTSASAQKEGKNAQKISLSILHIDFTKKQKTLPKFLKDLVADFFLNLTNLSFVLLIFVLIPLSFPGDLGEAIIQGLNIASIVLLSAMVLFFILGTIFLDTISEDHIQKIAQHCSTSIDVKCTRYDATPRRRSYVTFQLPQSKTIDLIAARENSSLKGPVAASPAAAGGARPQEIPAPRAPAI